MVGVFVGVGVKVGVELQTVMPTALVVTGQPLVTMEAELLMTVQGSLGKPLIW